MPWKECKTMDEKLKFVARFLDSEKIADNFSKTKKYIIDKLLPMSSE